MFSLLHSASCFFLFLFTFLLTIVSDGWAILRTSVLSVIVRLNVIEFVWRCLRKPVIAAET